MKNLPPLRSTQAQQVSAVVDSCRFVFRERPGPCSLTKVSQTCQPKPPLPPSDQTSPHSAAGQSWSAWGGRRACPQLCWGHTGQGCGQAAPATMATYLGWGPPGMADSHTFRANQFEPLAFPLTGTSETQKMLPARAPGSSTSDQQLRIHQPRDEEAKPSISMLSDYLELLPSSPAQWK